LITASPAWRKGGALFLTWDESTGANPVATLVLAPGVPPRASDRRYDHYSLLATVQDLLGVPRLGAAVGAPAMTDLLLPASS
jgi:acid phosphatase